MTVEMKIVADRKSLLSALSATVPIAAGARFNDILQGVLISADADRATVLATDTAVVARRVFDAEIDQPGQVLAPAVAIRGMLTQMTDEKVFLSVDDKSKSLSIQGARTKHKMATAKHSEFPALPDAKWIATCKMPAVRFATFLRAVSPQVADSDFRGFAVQNLFIEFGERTVALVATDGRAVAIAEFDAEPSAQCNALIPASGVKVLAATGSDSGEVSLMIGDNWIEAQTSSLLVMVRLFEGRFPKWRQFAPHGTSPIAEIYPAALTSCIRQTCVASPDSEHGPRVNLRIGDGVISAKCEAGNCVSESEIPCSTQGSLEALVNWRYLLEALGGLALVSDLPATLHGSSPLVFHRDELTFAIVPLTKE